MSSFLRDDKVSLKKLSPTDNLESYLEFINDVENLKWVEGVGNLPMNREDLIEFLSNQSNWLWGIFDNNNLHIGNIQLTLVSQQHRNAQFGLILSKDHHGKGNAVAACKLILKHVFEVLNFHRLYLMVVTENQPAIALYEKLGFLREGVAKECHLYNFKYYDCITYYLLEDRYKTLRDKGAEN